jgi:hypothetical protein
MQKFFVTLDQRLGDHLSIPDFRSSRQDNPGTRLAPGNRGDPAQPLEPDEIASASRAGPHRAA